MEIKNNINLKDHLTMRLGGQAKYMVEINCKEDIKNAYQYAEDHGLKVFILGGGSNTLATDKGFDGLVMLMKIKGTEVIAEDEDSITFKIGAGEILDAIVKKSVEMHLTGIEAMSMIPGTIGAAPVQNVGAYGQDISQTFVSLEAYDTNTKSFVTLSKDDCQFSYRHSIFRGSAWGRYVIHHVTITLKKGNPTPPFYKQVQDTLTQDGITEYTPDIIRETVIKIRTHKLPDPEINPNCGSFFKNAIISKEKLASLQKDYPELKGFKVDEDHYKISTGWLIDKAGLKGHKLHQMKVHDRNALVLINDCATSYESLAEARDEIIQIVKDKFDITISQEVLEMS